MHPAPLFTIGYQGRSLDELITLLQEHGVEEVVDVRELPLSHVKGFSKSPLSAALSAAGLDYRLIRELGVPREARQAYRHTGDWSAFTEAYLILLDYGQDRVLELIDEARRKTVCLLCFERDSSRCHRSLLAERIKQLTGNEFQVVHL